MRSNLRPILVVLAIAAVVGGLVGWWVTRSSVTAPPPPPIKQAETPKTNEETSAAQPMVEITPADGTNTTETTEAPLGEVNAKNWEDHLDQILGDDKIDEDKKADKIADMIPKLPEPAQKELAEHLVNLISDENYAKAADILKNEKTPKSVGQVLLDDLYNRDDTLKLPLALDLAKNDNHPLKEEAKEMLEMATQEDYGTNWVQWTEAVNKVLKGEQP